MPPAETDFTIPSIWRVVADGWCPNLLLLGSRPNLEPNRQSKSAAVDRLKAALKHGASHLIMS